MKKPRVYQMGSGYILRVSQKETGSNHNTFAHVFLNGSKMPEFCTSFNDNTPISEIKEWATDNIKIQSLNQ